MFIVCIIINNFLYKEHENEKNFFLLQKKIYPKTKKKKWVG